MGMGEEVSMSVYKVVLRYKYRKIVAFLAILFLLASVSFPLKAYVQANRYMLAGTTDHWGVAVSWFIQNHNGVDNFKEIMDRNENASLLRELKKFNDAILFVIHPNVIRGGIINPEIATFATESQLIQIQENLVNFPNCSFQQVTLGSDDGNSNVIVVFIFGYIENGVWPVEIVQSCIERVRAKVQPSGEK